MLGLWYLYSPAYLVPAVPGSCHPILPNFCASLSGHPSPCTDLEVICVSGHYILSSLPDLAQLMLFLSRVCPPHLHLGTYLPHPSASLDIQMPPLLPSCSQAHHAPPLCTTIYPASTPKLDLEASPFVYCPVPLGPGGPGCETRELVPVSLSSSSSGRTMLPCPTSTQTTRGLSSQSWN